MGPNAMIFIFWMSSVNQRFHPPLSLSSRGSSVLSQFLWWGWCFLHIWGYWYFPQQSWFQLLLHPVGIMYFAYKLNKQGDNIQPLPTGFLIWNQSIVPCSVLTCFLTCIQISQKAGKMVWYSHLWKFSAVCCDPHSQGLLHGQYSRSRCFSRILLFFPWSNRCWQFDFWFHCLF